VNQQTDAQLLRAYAEDRSDAAFSELVRRHVDFTYSAAVRMVRDRHLAEDVTQGVFVALANRAAQLLDRPVLSGWLHRTAQNIAAQAVRTIERRRAREQEAAAMNELFSMTAEMDLTPEQQDKIHAAIYQYDLNQTSSTQNSAAMSQVRASGNPADILSLAVNTQQQALDAKLQILDGILSAEQLQTYKQGQLDMIEMQTGAMKLFLPQVTNGVSQ
jgi:DNA-directed RNA polymerase specialized sigma24 family protein